MSIPGLATSARVARVDGGPTPRTADELQASSIQARASAALVTIRAVLLKTTERTIEAVRMSAIASAGGTLRSTHSGTSGREATGSRPAVRSQIETSSLGISGTDGLPTT